MKKPVDEDKVPAESMNPPLAPQQDASPPPGLNSSNKKKIKKKARKNSGHESFSQSALVEGSDLGDIKDEAGESGLNIPTNI